MAEKDTLTYTSKWKYKGLDPSSNRLVSGYVYAVNEKAARAAVFEQGFITQKVKRARGRANKASSLKKRKIQKKLINEFMRDLATNASSGVHISQSLEYILQGQKKNSKLTPLIVEVKTAIEDGVPPPDAFAAFKVALGETPASVMQLGQSTGKLPEALSALADSTQQSEEINKAVKSAIRQPMVMGGFLILLTILSIAFILPLFESMFEEMAPDADLPPVMSALLGIGDFFGERWLVILILMAGCVLFLQWLRHNMKVRLWFSYYMLKAPIVGRLFECQAACLVADLLAVAADAGAPIDKALEMTAKATNSSSYKKALEQIVVFLRDGGNIVDGFRKYSPPLPTIMQTMAQQSSGPLPDPGLPWRRYAAAMYKDALRRADQIQPYIQVLILIAGGIFVGILGYALTEPMIALPGEISKIR